jgi:hypothetical protein
MESKKKKLMMNSIRKWVITMITKRNNSYSIFTMRRETKLLPKI